MATCTNCGEFVTRQFTRVFGDNDDDVAGCPRCASITDLKHGVIPEAEY